MSSIKSITEDEFGNVQYEHLGGRIDFFNKEGQLHRLNGPAIYYPDGKDCLWFINHKQIPCNSQEEFERLIKLKAFW
ncbi:hypothetical protein UFOVP1290_280 [uncultured Caudovirales phage]|uniref:Uncharacterized protein n=1 Tax=uncultured Caudovirales phage TaxID=2100421 RepID=A0A6J5RGS9_9CAUD|nr:hypothetical protein UFOVP1290_280 [uncultured Caudovirales phage]